MTPVDRGGSNDKENLQVICRPCNMRKGIQTDEEFRIRYSQLIPSQRLTRPRRQISQGEFRAVTQRTNQSDTVRKFRKSRFYTKRNKIAAGCIIVFAVTAYIIVLPLHYSGFEGFSLALPPVIVGLAAGGSIWLRAYMTGAMMEEE